MTEGGRRNRWSLGVFVMMRTDGVVGMDGGGSRNDGVLGSSESVFG